MAAATANARTDECDQHPLGRRSSATCNKTAFYQTILFTASPSVDDLNIGGSMDLRGEGTDGCVKQTIGGAEHQVLVNGVRDVEE
jgi:hypothetical protein